MKCHAIGQSPYPQKHAYSPVNLPTTSTTSADSSNWESPDISTGSCTESHLENQGTQPYESSFLGTSSDLEAPRSSSTFPSPTQESTEPSSNTVSSPYPESEEVTTGPPSVKRPRKAKLKASQAMRMYLSTTPSEASRKITFRPKASKKPSGFSGVRQEQVSPTPPGNKQDWTLILKTPVPSIGTDTEDRSMSSSMSSEGLSRYLIFSDGSTNIQQSSKSRDPALHSPQNPFGSRQI